MNRCAICDCTDEENPKADIQLRELLVETEPEIFLNIEEYRCEECHRSIQENIEDLNLEDEDFEYSI